MLALGFEWLEKIMYRLFSFLLIQLILFSLVACRRSSNGTSTQLSLEQIHQLITETDEFYRIGQYQLAVPKGTGTENMRTGRI